MVGIDSVLCMWFEFEKQKTHTKNHRQNASKRYQKNHLEATKNKISWLEEDEQK